MKIYIVVGTTGEYSDRKDWNVIAYRTERKANNHVRKAQIRAVEIEKNKSGRYSELTEKNEFDSNMKMDYTGTEYYTTSCELKEES